MARPRGVRNPDFDEKRAALVNALVDHALNTGLTRASLRQFAIAAGVSEPTLRHYFTDRTGVVLAVMEAIAERGDRFMRFAATPLDTYEDSLKSYADLSLAGVKHGGFERAHAFGLIEGVADPKLGEAYLRLLLEPSLAAIEAKITGFIDPEGAKPDEVRAAALMFFAPMLLGVLHQHVLGGREVRPLDMQKYFGLLARGMAGAFPEHATPASSAI